MYESPKQRVSHSDNTDDEALYENVSKADNTLPRSIKLKECSAYEIKDN